MTARQPVEVDTVHLVKKNFRFYTFSRRKPINELRVFCSCLKEFIIKINISIVEHDHEHREFGHFHNVEVHRLMTVTFFSVGAIYISWTCKRCQGENTFLIHMNDEQPTAGEEKRKGENSKFGESKTFN